MDIAGIFAIFTILWKNIHILDEIFNSLSTGIYMKSIWQFFSIPPSFLASILCEAIVSKNHDLFCILGPKEVYYFHQIYRFFISMNYKIFLIFPQNERWRHSISLWFCPLFCPLFHFPCVLPSNFALALALNFSFYFALVFWAKLIAKERPRARAKFEGKIHGK